ncbi:DUF2306 domain-containing protein [Christiangramia sp. SM2212]|uniref:DUF2306 domain-containing protein n=1 Tax=Christiangramia sediminicola TaxID=3073267 RepID=A0ABU1ENE7_9FLAO|nr:DUF2306 domain-containing protein [Christiangramia sp. SM2212]MDR5589919.1 DUF2306 domain-containing protein [Christiangramia sp. SM2212]
MKKLVYNSKWMFFGILCISIGLYPIIYFVADRNFGLLASKTDALLSDQIWNYAFYGHIVPGGLALLIGWTQFSSRIRKKRIKIHRNIGRIYLFSVIISGICGFYIAQFATGGISNIIGFSLSALIWLGTTIGAYIAITKGNIKLHQNLMIFSYAICFSAVTLRIWLPILISATGDFIIAYRIVGWLSWVPNLVVAYFIITKREKRMVNLSRQT